MPFTIQDLEQRVKARAAASAEVSYTRKLLDRGVAHCAKKLGEEAIETVLAAVGEDRERLIAEAADLVYHLIVAGDASFADLKRVLGDAELIHETQDTPKKYLFCRADSLVQMTSKNHALEHLPGVTSVQVSLNREMMFATEFVHRLVRERIKE